MKKLLTYFSVFFTLFAVAAFPDPTPHLTKEPLKVEQAFHFFGTTKDDQTLVLTWKIAPGYYLYKSRIHFKALDPTDVQLGEVLFPTAQKKKYGDGQTLEVYFNMLNIAIPVIQTSNNLITLQVNYQGCSSAEFCYPPVSDAITLNLQDQNAVFHPAQIDLQKPTNPITQLLSHNLFTSLIGFLGIGLLLSFTPCVLPMIPILSGIIIGQRKITLGRSFLLSLAYVLGMAITYAAAGVLFGYLGSNIQTSLQQPWIIAGYSCLFVIMALSLFGLFALQLPEKIRAYFGSLSHQTKHGTVIGAAIMGVLSTLILSPCVTPALVSLLSYISATGNALLGGLALFTMAIGMGLPLLIIGITGGRFLPKTGVWMNTVKNSLGILLLGLAIFTLQRIVSAQIIMVLWALLAAGIALYLGALTTSKTRWQFFKKCIGLLLFFYGILLIIGAHLGNTDPLHPLYFTKQHESNRTNLFIRIHTLKELKYYLAQADKNHQLTLLDFSARWCISCGEIDRFVFENANVRNRLANVLCLRADITDNNADNQLLQKTFSVVAPPTIIFFRHTQEIPGSRIIGGVSAKEFLQHIKQL